MRRIILLSVCVLVIVLAGLSFVLTAAPFPLGHRVAPGVLTRDVHFGKLPLYFIPNRGQVSSEAVFYSVTPRYTLWMASWGLVFDSVKYTSDDSMYESGKQPVDREVTQFLFLGANEKPSMEAIDKADYRVNFYKGNDPSLWKTDVPTSRAVCYKNIYRNIDVKVYGVENRIEYDWIIKPGGNPSDIRFQYKNAQGTRIDGEGNLVIDTRFGEMIHKKPVSFQWIEGKKKPVASMFKVIGKDSYSFKVGVYDKRFALVIDPEVSLNYGTYLGGKDEEWCGGIFVDKDGCLYATGYTFSTDFRLENPIYPNIVGGCDLYVVKLTPDGTSLLYSTFMGGGKSDVGRTLAVNSEGMIGIAGDTMSTDFPGANPADIKGDQEALAVILDSDGKFVYSKYFSGSAFDSFWSVSYDDEDRFYFAGHTLSENFPVTSNAFQPVFGGNVDATLCIINPIKGVLYSTYFGGSKFDGAFGVLLDNNRNIVITGNTMSDGSDFPKKNALFSSYGGESDGFIAKFSHFTNSGLNLIFSTYLGGSDFDDIRGTAMDSVGNVYVSGTTKSKNFPVTSNAFQKLYGGGESDGFYAKMTSNGQSLVYASYLGGQDTDNYPDIAVSYDQNVYVYMTTLSTNLPVKNAAWTYNRGYNDTYLVKFCEDGRDLIFATYYGGNGDDTRGKITVDDQGDVYVSGKTSSKDLPLKNPLQKSHASSGVYDTFLAKFSYSHDLLIQSHPDASVPITVSQKDVNDNSSGQTPYRLYYLPSQTVELTAPATFNNRNFYKWSVDDTEFFTRSISVRMDTKHTVTAVYGSFPSIALNRERLNFGCVLGSVSTSSQRLIITNSGGGTLNWSVSSNQPWIICTPGSGKNTGYVDVSVNTLGLSYGTYSGLILVSDPGALNSPLTVSVTLKVHSAAGTGSSAKPFGDFATPGDGASVYGSIPVTGWALDDIDIASVKIYRDDDGARRYIGDALFVEGARPDVEALFPSYPNCFRAGWGYMLLTNFLPNGGNGTYKIYAVAEDKEGNQVTLGEKTIHCDNAHAVKPFGAIDTPGPGATVTGATYVNYGWALTPQPNYIPTDGHTLWVCVDGKNIGHPTYNNGREDIYSLFPGYANSIGAVGFFYLDTTKYANGLHAIQWTATDSAGNSDGIGSRYFSVLNESQIPVSPETADSKPIPAENTLELLSSSLPIIYRKGYLDQGKSYFANPDEKGVIRLTSEELGRIVVELSGDRKTTIISGYSVVGHQLRPLPVGSTLDTSRGIFYWQHGPGFVGEYKLVFIEQNSEGKTVRKNIIITLAPKFK